MSDGPGILHHSVSPETAAKKLRNSSELWASGNTKMPCHLPDKTQMKEIYPEGFMVFPLDSHLPMLAVFGFTAKDYWKKNPDCGNKL